MTNNPNHVYERLAPGRDSAPGSLHLSMATRYVNGYPEDEIQLVSSRVIKALVRIKTILNTRVMEVKVEPRFVGAREGVYRLYLGDTSEVPRDLWHTTPTSLWGLGLLIVKMLFRREAFRNFDPANNLPFCQNLLRVINFKLQGVDVADQGSQVIHHLFDEKADYYLRDDFITALTSSRKIVRLGRQALFFAKHAPELWAAGRRPCTAAISTNLLRVLQACFGTNPGPDGSGYTLDVMEAVAAMPFFIQ